MDVELIHITLVVCCAAGVYFEFMCGYIEILYKNKNNGSHLQLLIELQFG